MIRTFVLSATAVLAVAAFAGRSHPTADEAAVRVALEHYLAGHATGDGARMRIAFHPDAMLFWAQDGALGQRTATDYSNGFTGRPAADEARRRGWIESVDVAGTVAIGKIVLDYPNARFVDYMSLVKTGGEWKIVNKIYHREPRP